MYTKILNSVAEQLNSYFLIVYALSLSLSKAYTCSPDYAYSHFKHINGFTLTLFEFYSCCFCENDFAERISDNIFYINAANLNSRFYSCE